MHNNSLEHDDNRPTFKFRPQYVEADLHKSHAHAQRSPQHEKVSYIGPILTDIEILENRACTMNFRKTIFQ